MPNTSSTPTGASSALSHGLIWADPARLSAFDGWLARLTLEHGLQIETVRPASADASFRRYLRVDTAAGGSLVIMDAPPEHENCHPFVAVDRLLRTGGVEAPEILAWDEALGFMLLADLGQHTLLSTLVPDAPEHSPGYRANQMRYEAAIDELIALQQIPAQGLVPAYDDALLQRELDLAPQWYFTQLRGMVLTEQQQAVLDRAFGLIKAQVLAQPCGLVHRDYHSRNLMVSPSDPGARPGVIDFQDAVWGPLAYDPVSLLRDAYVVWNESIQIDLAARYWQKARKAGLPLNEDFGEFWRDFEWMGLQRHLKVLGIFARLALRDGKQQYLDDIPRVWQYAHKVCTRYQGLGPLSALLEAAESATLGVQRQTGYTF
jgi:aminoglycoside/choline kinase family phosphotransferase